MRKRLIPMLATTALAALLVGCNNGTSNLGSSQVSDSASPAASASAVPDSASTDANSSGSSSSGSTTTTVTVPTTVVVPTTVTQPPPAPNQHYRPMNNSEKQSYERCRRDPRVNDCNNYSDTALRKRGIDPNS